MNANELTIKQARELLDRGDLTAIELTQACLLRIKELDRHVKACLTVCSDEALEMAKAADERLKKGERTSLLGIPCLVKDILLTKGIKTTAASKMLENYIAPYDATVVKKIKEAGAIILGKTNLDEFAHGASTENSAYGPTHNPWDLTRVPGGSSGGSAAGVASNMCLFALGTDTGGSIRQPASFCGVCGMKPTYGLVSRFGLMSMTSSTDTVGVFAKTAEDTALVLQTISGKDEKDLTTSETKLKYDFQDSLKGIKIGLPKEYFIDELDGEVKKIVEEATEQLKNLGAEIIEISLPNTKYAVPAYYIITPSEVSSNLARFDGVGFGLSANHEEIKNIKEFYQKSRGLGFGPEAKRRIMLGTYALSAGYYDAYYIKAQKVRAKIKEEFIEAFKNVDIIITPTSPHVAFKIGEKVDDPLQMYLEDIFLSGVSLAGLPGFSIPAGFKNGLPVGVQLIGSKFNEAVLLNLAYNYQKITNWHLQKPQLSF